jgi:hypothetical protein
MPIRRALLAILASLLVAVPAAHAGSPGKWTMLGQANVDNIDEVALARTTDGTLHALWTIPSHNNGGSGDSLVHDTIAANGTTGTPNVVTAGWAAIENVPDMVTEPDGSLRAFFGGIRTTDPNEPNSNMNTATAPASGDPWTLFPGTVVTDSAAYGSDTGVALFPDGTPMISFGGTGSGAFVHRSLDPNQPNYNLQDQFGGCCGYSPDVAIDSKNGNTFVVWYSNATNHLGVFAQALNPATGQPSGAAVQMPGSTTIFNGAPNSNQQLTRTPIAARVGGGVYVAYGGGYPTRDKVLLWRIADTKSAVVGTSAHDHTVSLAADPDGRIWVFWIDNGSQPTVFARRSNKSVTAFGPAVAVGHPPGQDSAYRITGNAQATRLDIVAEFGSLAANAIAQWHTQVLAGLELTASPSKIKGSKKTAVTFRVSDPDPVSGATVSAGGKSAKTNAKGKATIDLGPTSKKSIVATATKADYTKATTKVRVGR